MLSKRKRRRQKNIKVHFHNQQQSQSSKEQTTKEKMKKKNCINKVLNIFILIKKCGREQPEYQKKWEKKIVQIQSEKRDFMQSSAKLLRKAFKLLFCHVSIFLF